MKIQHIISLILFVGCMTIVGCGWLDPVTKTDTHGNPVVDAQGNPVIDAKGAQYLEAAQDIANTAGGIPIYGGIASGIAGILGIAVGFMNQVARKRANALEATVLGVNTFAKNYKNLEESVINILKSAPNENLAANVQEIFSMNEGPKKIIQKIANGKDIETFLKKFIQHTEMKSGHIK